MTPTNKNPRRIDRRFAGIHVSYGGTRGHSSRCQLTARPYRRSGTYGVSRRGVRPDGSSVQLDSLQRYVRNPGHEWGWTHREIELPHSGGVLSRGLRGTHQD